METMKLTVCEGLQVSVQPSREHEFVMTTREVAKGFGVSNSVIRNHKMRHEEELIKGKHFYTTYVSSTKKYENIEIPPTKKTYWTKLGIIRLSSFIKSGRSRRFRDWAEGLIVATVNNNKITYHTTHRRRARRVSNCFVIDLLQDIAHIEDKQVRIRITQKLLKQRYGKAE